MSELPQETCWSLIRGAADGRHRERDVFVQRYEPIVRVYLRTRWRMSPLIDEVEDATQEVFLQCFRPGGVLAGVDPGHGSSFRALLYGVTKNVALHLERTRARRIVRVQNGGVEPDETPMDEPTLSRVFDREYARSIMRDAREEMRRRAGSGDAGKLSRVELLRLRFEDGLPIRKIAEMWQQEPVQMHREYARAAREFKAALSVTVAQSERCPPHALDAECQRLLDLLGER